MRRERHKEESAFFQLHIRFKAKQDIEEVRRVGDDDLRPCESAAG
jgi:hypothetical protein